MALTGGTHYSNYLARVTRIYQKKEVKLYTNLILSLFATSFFAFFAIRPTLATIFALKKEVKDQKEVSLKLDKKIQDLSQAQQEYAKVRVKLYLVDLALPQTPQPSIFLGQVELLAQESNLEIKALQTRSISIRGAELAEKGNENQEKSPYPSFITKISLLGQYQEIENFLHSIDNLTRVFNISDFSISKGKKLTSGQLGLTFEIKTYYLPPEKEKTV